MILVFDDMCKAHLSCNGALGFISLWVRILKDLARSVAKEHLTQWRKEMRRKQIIPIAIGSLFLVYSMSFAAVNILKYTLGFGDLWNPFEGIINSARPSLLSETLNGLIILGPALAFAFYVLPLITVRIDLRSDQIATIGIGKANRLTMLLIGLCLSLGALFVVYFVGENLPCLLGQQTVC
jgi:hypothetical protein